MDTDAPALHPELVDIADLSLDPANARRHSERNLSVIGYSLEKFQQVKAIVVHRRTKVVIAGNGTLSKAIKMGAEKIVVSWVDKVRVDGHLRDMTDEEAVELAILDNRSADLAEWDVEVLTAKVEAFPDVDWGALGFGADDLGSGVVNPDVPTITEHTPEGATEIDVDSFEFAHTCPRCKFEFNDG